MRHLPGGNMVHPLACSFFRWPSSPAPYKSYFNGSLEGI